MRYLFLISAVLALNLSLIRADEGDDKFYMLAQGCDVKKGSLEIWPYEDSVLWLNGVRQSTHGQDSSRITIREGDVLITGSPMIWYDYGKSKPSAGADFYRYRLDKLTPQRAYFTRWGFDAVVEPIDSQTKCFRMGALRNTNRFQIELTRPHFLLVDYGPNYVEMASGKSVRTK